MSKHKHDFRASGPTTSDSKGNQTEYGQCSCGATASRYRPANGGWGNWQED